MYSPKRLLTAVEHASSFFHSYPQAVEPVETAIKEQGIAVVFHQMADSLRSELEQKESAGDTHDEVKRNIRELSHSLRTRARHLEDGINSLLHLTGNEAHEIDLMRSENDIADYKNFSEQMKSALSQMTTGDFFSVEAKKFDDELAAYEKACGSVGDTFDAKEKEADDVSDFTQRNHAIAASLLALCREYLRQVNPALRKELSWRKINKSSAPSVANTEAEGVA